MPDTLRDERRFPIFIHSAVDDMTTLSPNAFRVYAHLARRAGSDNRAWPSYRAIGDHCFASVYDNAEWRKRQAMEAVKELVTAGLVRKEDRFGDDGQHSNLYVMCEIPLGVSPHSLPSESTLTPPVSPHSLKGTPIEDTTYVASQPHGVAVTEQRDALPATQPLLLVEESLPQQQSAETVDKTDYPKTEASSLHEEPVSFVDEMHGWMVRLRDEGNKTATLRALYVRLYGETTAPNYGYLGRVAKTMGSSGMLATRLVELVTRPPNGDILAYILAEHKGKQSRKVRQENSGGGSSVSWAEAWAMQEEKENGSDDQSV